MSIQSLSNSAPSPEPAAQRRRAAGPEGASAGETFALSDGAGMQAEAASARRETKPAGGLPKPAVPTTGTEAAKGGAAAPVPAPATAKTDAGALVTLTAAVPAGAEATPPAAEGNTDDKDAAEAAKAEAGIDAASMVVAAPAMPLAPVIVPGLAPPASPASGEVVAKGEAAPAAGIRSAAGHPTGAGAAPFGLGGRQTSTAPAVAEIALALGAEPKGAASPKAAEAATGSDRPATPIQVGGEGPVRQAGGVAEALGGFKTFEAVQPTQNPIDLSALTPQIVAGGDPARLLSAFEQPAAQPGGAAGSHGASGGQPTPLHVVPIEIGLRALSGARQFDIRLDPDELGRVDVSLSISDDGEINARLVVDRVETLHLLQRDARTLERAFEQAGLKPSDGGVDISLRDPADQSGFRQNRQQDEAQQRSRLGTDASDGDEATIPVEPAAPRRLVRLGGVDLSI